MAIANPEQELSTKEGRLAPIFLAQESKFDGVNLFDYSREFHERHREILQAGFGIVSGLTLLGGESQRAEPARETIVFDARTASEGVYGWELCYATEPGVQNIVRLKAGAASTEGVFAKTSNQGLFLPWASFPLSPVESHEVSLHLLKRLASPDVQCQIEQIYQIRRGIKGSIVDLVNKRAAEQRAYQLRQNGSSGMGPDPYYAEQIRFKEKHLESLGFSALTLFRKEWLQTLEDD